MNGVPQKGSAPFTGPCAAPVDVVIRCRAVPVSLQAAGVAAPGKTRLDQCMKLGGAEPIAILEHRRQDAIDLRDLPGGEPETRTSVGRTTNRVRALTGIRIGSLAMPRIEAGRHRPIAATLHPTQHKAHHRRIHSLYKIVMIERKHLVQVSLRMISR